MPKILLIDDDPRTRKLISDNLEQSGHEVLFAQDGAFGVSMSTLEIPDVIILDVMMPIMTGPETLRALKADPDMKNIPVIVLTALEDFELEESMLAQGAVAYFTKPVNLQELINCIEGTLTFRRRT